MATKKGRSFFKVTDEDLKGKTFKTAPGGVYTIKGQKNDTKIKPGSSGDVMQLKWMISKGPHAKITLFDNVGVNVGWKIGQLLGALGYTVKQINKMTPEDVIKIVQGGVELRASIRKKMWDGSPQNKIAQYLPLLGEDAGDDDDDEDEDEDEDEEESDEEDEDESDDEEEEEEEDDDDDDDDDGEEEEEEEDEGEDEEDEEDDVDDDEDEDEDEEDEGEEEEDEPVPARRSPAKKSTPRKRR